MQTKTLTTSLAALALALGLAGQASAQAPSFRRPQPQTQAKKPSAGSVKITETPAEETPTAAATTAQTTTPPPMATAAPAMPAAQSNQPRDEMAVSAARDWLALVDAGQFGDSYDQAGELFRGALPKEQWANALGASRKPLGDVSQRNLKSVVVTKDLPNAPAGKYVVSTFDTAFQQQPKPMWEVVTSFLNPSGQWKVVGYQVKPQDAAAGQKPSQK